MLDEIHTSATALKGLKWYLVIARIGMRYSAPRSKSTLREARSRGAAPASRRAALAHHVRSCMYLYVPVWVAARARRTRRRARATERRARARNRGAALASRRAASARLRPSASAPANI